MMRIPIVLVVSIVVLALSGCFPYTSVPMVALTSYDMSQKRDRWREYAKEGDVYAMFELAESYRARPFEGALDRAEAFNWYCAAARNGYGKAQIMVGEIYQGITPLSGIEMKMDFAKAHMWYSLAWRRAMREAFNRLQAVESEMTPHEKAAAKKMIQNFKTVPCGMEDKNVKRIVEEEIKTEKKPTKEKAS